MTIKRLVLILLTAVAILFSGSSLLGSLTEPQIQSRLELYQTNLLLQATEWQLPDSKDTTFKTAQAALLGANPLETATEQYQQVRKSAQKNLNKANQQLAKLRSQPVLTSSNPPSPSETTLALEKQLQKSVSQIEKLIAEIDLRLGILQAQQDNPATARATWEKVEQNSSISPQYVDTAKVLTELWSNPTQIEPDLASDAQQLIPQNLEGWFSYQALRQFYQVQGQEQALAALKTNEQAAAEQALLKLAVIGTIPALGGLTGLGLLLLLLGQRLFKGKESLLAQNEDLAWVTPWNGETILQVFIYGFFLMGQFFVPIVLKSVLPINRAIGDVRLQAFYVLISYLTVAVGALSVLYFSIKSFFPLAKDWFKFNLFDTWFLWGFGGYLTALPLVVVVSLLNQQLWQGQGGSNPLLQLALESQDGVALGIFFFTAAIAAPIFEEILFRGFLLPSLTRYMSVWAAIALSSFIFAVAHLSLSEVLPLTTLGMVLGIVYTRSRNLLSSMLLHSLWNSGTLLSLFVLGSGSS
jgi:membrane protease YdiL (CAAX protease family)